MLALYQRASRRNCLNNEENKITNPARRFSNNTEEKLNDFRTNFISFHKELDETLNMTTSSVSSDETGIKEGESRPKEEVGKIITDKVSDEDTPYDIHSPFKQSRIVAPIRCGSLQSDSFSFGSGDSFDMKTDRPDNHGRKNLGVKMKVELDVVDDIHEEIRVEVFICLHYTDDNATRLIQDKNSPEMKSNEKFILRHPSDHPEIFNPQFEFLNARTIQHTEGFKLLISKSTGVVYCYRVYLVSLRHVLALERFPFDRQIVKIHLRSFTGRFVKWKSPHNEAPSGVRTDQNWSKFDALAEYTQSLWVLNWVRGEADYADANPSEYRLCFGVSRTSTFYMVNFVFAAFLVVISAVTSIAVEHDNFGDRASITFTLLLTLVTFRFVMSTYIPKISYLTYLDYYNIVGMMMVIGVILENFVVAKFHYDVYTANSVDWYFAVVFVVSWGLFHIGIITCCRYGWFQADWDIALENNVILEKSQKVYGNRHVKKNTVIMSPSRRTSRVYSDPSG